MASTTLALAAALSAFLVAAAAADSRGIGVRPGPSVIATRGEVWPAPQQQKRYDTHMIVSAGDFEFKIANQTCEILEDAVRRYAQVIKAQDKRRRRAKGDGAEARRRALATDANFSGYLASLRVDLMSPCEDLPRVDMDEKYVLRVDSPDARGEAMLTSASIWGVLRGLETFSQLVYLHDDSASLLVNGTSITDFPRFPHRGLLLDTSRHYLPLRTIYVTLDAMAMNKFNVFHWHIVDDHSFPYQSSSYPRLSQFGAYTQRHVYTVEDVKNVIKYAAARGIRVMPEFDTPGHTRSWGEGYPELLTTCYRGNQPDGTLGPMNPLLNNTYNFMDRLLAEIRDVFPEEYIHLGGDEVDFRCWESNPETQKYVREKNATFEQLEEMYVRRLLRLATAHKFKSIVWQEVFDNGVDVPKDVLIHVWKVRGYAAELSAVTSAGYGALLSAPWYLDHVSGGGDWIKYYNLDPLNFTGSADDKRRLAGGEACMWGEHVDSTNVLTRIWPRASAVAEKLWSPATRNYQRAARRLEEHVCRMNGRGYPAQPANGPGFCPYVNY